MKRMDKYAVTDADTWTWSTAQFEDVEAIMDLMEQQYQAEIESVLTPSRPRMAYSLHKALLQQVFEPNTVLIMVAKDKTNNELQSWSWIHRGGYAPYSVDEMAVAEFIHTQLSLSPRTKIKLVAQVLLQWEAWCKTNQIPVISSTSIRADQTAFMRLHERFGYSVRGSIAYKRIAQ